MSTIANLFLFKIILRTQIQTAVLFSSDRFPIYVSSRAKLYLNSLIKKAVRCEDKKLHECNIFPVTLKELSEVGQNFLTYNI